MSGAEEDEGTSDPGRPDGDASEAVPPAAPTDPATVRAEVARSAAFANAYAVTYRLLGDRGVAAAAAVSIATDHVGRERRAPETWLPFLAADSVTEALRTADEMADAGDTRLAGVRNASTREALRRRLVGTDRRTRTTVGLHQFAGYDPDRVGELMGCPSDEVTSLTAAFSPSPGVRWADLGDPELRATADPVRRRRRQRLRAAAVAGVVCLVVLAIVALVATSEGPRPTVGTTTAEQADRDTTEADRSAGDAADPGAEEVHEDTPPLPASGCGNPEGDLAPVGGPTTEQTTDLDGGGGATVPYRLTPARAGDGARPFVVSVGDGAEDPEAFQAQSQLETLVPDSVHATIAAGAPAATAEVVDAIRGVVDAVVQGSCVDVRRITLVGHGSGAAAVGTAACRTPDLFAGVAMVGAWVDPTDCDLEPPVSVLIAANDDDRDAADGGAALSDIGSRWASALGAGGEEVEARGEDTLIRRWRGPDGVTLTTIWHPGGGDAWALQDPAELATFLTATARTAG